MAYSFIIKSEEDISKIVTAHINNLNTKSIQVFNMSERNSQFGICLNYSYSDQNKQWDEFICFLKTLKSYSSSLTIIDLYLAEEMFTDLHQKSKEAFFK